jgi:hypothetical protein
MVIELRVDCYRLDSIFRGELSDDRSRGAEREIGTGKGIKGRK